MIVHPILNAQHFSADCLCEFRVVVVHGIVPYVGRWVE